MTCMSSGGARRARTRFGAAVARSLCLRGGRPRRSRTRSVRQLPELRQFRHGHPCWRKITDPLLLSDDRDEMIVLDPDLYFPNRFRFEETPASGLLLMWQRPSCLLPDEVVEAAIGGGISLAHHTDIGVVQWRAPVDLEWLNWVIRKLGSSQFPRHMHVESIVWAALAMKMGGGYLDPGSWVCWHRSQYKRLLVKFGVSGPSILEREQFSGIKCFHAGGVAKWWLAAAHTRGLLDRNEDVTQRRDPALYRTRNRLNITFFSYSGGGWKARLLFNRWQWVNEFVPVR